MKLFSKHYKRVRKMMRLMVANNPEAPPVPEEPTIPPFHIRRLRAKLILEEAVETIKAMGVRVGVKPSLNAYDPIALVDSHLVYSDLGDDKVDIIEVIDGCCDIHVVTTGTQIAFGVGDVLYQKAIDDSNNDKFRGDAHLREDGKWVKPSDWVAPDLQDILLDELIDKDADILFFEENASFTRTDGRFFNVEKDGWMWFADGGNMLDETIYPTFAKAWCARRDHYLEQSQPDERDLASTALQ